jgi:hypothetical protein
MTAPAPSAPPPSGLRNRRRYRRAAFTTARLEVFLAIALVAGLLALLATVVLPSPWSTVTGGVIVATALFLALFDKEHEDHVGR